MKAVILAAGRGTRMRHLTENQPKPMLDIGKHRILDTIVDSIHQSGIDHLVVVIGYHANIIQDHFGDGSAFGLHITYVVQETLDGTAGALRLTEDTVGEEPFFLTFGDIITNPVNYSRIIQSFHEAQADALLGINKTEDPYLGAAVYFDASTLRISNIIEKPPRGTSNTEWNNSGLFVFSPSIFPYLHQIELSSRGEYELPDAIRLMIQDGKTVQAVPLQGFWGDLATPEDVECLRKLIEEDEHILQDTRQCRTLR